MNDYIDKERKITKILVEIHHGLGDVVQIIPLLENLRMNYPNGHIAAIVQSSSHEKLIMASGYVDTCYLFFWPKTNLSAFIELGLKLKREHFDILVVSPISSPKLSMLLKCVVKPKIMLSERNKYTNSEYCVTPRPELHWVERNINLLRALNLKIKRTWPQIIIDNDVQMQVLKKNTEFFSIWGNLTIGIAVGCGDVIKKNRFAKNIVLSHKRWSIKKWDALCEKLFNEGHKIILFGGTSEQCLISNTSFLSKDNPRVLNIIGKTSVMESAALASKCDLFIAADTGMLYIADALGTKTIGLFGPSDPNLVGVYSNNGVSTNKVIECQYCYGKQRLFECKRNLCMEMITVKKIIEKIDNRINNTF